MYNSDKYISEAVESILHQTFTDFELLIIDDASTDSSVSIIESYNDPRIKLIVKPQNTGYTNSLNMGLEMATGKYIARMDSDDISVLNRFEKQVSFLEANANVAVCGAWFKCIGTNEVIQHPATHDAIKVAMLSYCAIGHPTVVIRNSFLQKHGLSYNTAMEPAEDYDLWSRICCIGKLANIPEVLLHYRLHDGQVSSLRAAKQQHISNVIRTKLLSLLDMPLEKISAVYELQESITNKKSFFIQINNRLELLNKLANLNNSLQYFNAAFFNNFIQAQKQNWVKCYLSDNRAYSINNLICLFTKGRYFLPYINFKALVKYSIKCFIRANKASFF